MGFFSILYFIAISVVGLSSLANGYVYKSERELRQDIFSDYDKQVRPVKKASTTVSANITIWPLALRSMDEKDQILKLDTKMYLGWTDEYLRWNPTRYDGITELRISASEIWRPDISLHTAAADSTFFPTVQTNAIIYYNGVVSWFTPFTINSICPTPFRNYVSASSTSVHCTITMGSWSYDENLLKLHQYSNEISLSTLQYYNRKWKLVNIAPNSETKSYSSWVYSVVTFNVTLEKRYCDLNEN